MPPLELRFVSGPDVDALGVGRAEILAAVEDAVRAQGEGRVVLEPRVHLAPPNGGAGHFNVLRRPRARPGAPAGADPVLDRGLATTDLAVAQLLLRRAEAAGLGTLLRYR
jgi:ornithine cyclodeaminase/alanine dehydrogenase-like protein (mu-crystallin family)